VVATVTEHTKSSFACVFLCDDTIVLSKRDSTRMSFGLIVTYPGGQVE